MADQKFVKCSTPECKGGFKNVVAPFRGKCKVCKTKQQVVPNPGQEKKINPTQLYNQLYTALGDLYCAQIQALSLTDVYRSKYHKSQQIENTIDQVVERLENLMKNINPHRKLPTPYADDGNSTEEDDDDEPIEATYNSDDDIEDWLD